MDINVKGRGQSITNQANSIPKDLALNSWEKGENFHDQRSHKHQVSREPKREEVARHFDLLFVLCDLKGPHLKQNVIG